MGERNRECKIYVGNLPPDTREKDIEDVFYKYGRIVDVDVKNNRGDAPFAFIEFEDARDASDAVRGRDGYDMDGYRIRVELPRGVGPRGRGGRPVFGGGGGGGHFGGRGGPPNRRSRYRVYVTGLPPSGSWQDLKDHMREAGDVCFADVNRDDGTGVVEFTRYDDMKYAMRKLDDSKFRSHEGETAYIRVKEQEGGGGGGGGRGGGRSRSRSPRGGGSSRRSPDYGSSRDRRSPSYSAMRSRSRSGSGKGSDKKASRSRSASRSQSR